MDATCQYSDIAPAFSSRAIRRMLTASAPSTSATLIAARTISSRDRAGARRLGAGPALTSRDGRPRGPAGAEVRKQRPQVLAVIGFHDLPLPFPGD